MLITEKQFKKIKVETQSGQFLGYLVGFDLETDDGKIKKYNIKNNIITGLFSEGLKIDSQQVISFDSDKMIVEDSVVKEKVPVNAQTKTVEEIKGTEPVITSKKV